MIDIKDEILTGEPRYRLRDGNGNILQDNISIEQITPVTQEGTPINKELLENIQQQMFLDTKLLVAEYTLTEDMQEVTIEGLDIDKDGGVYDIIVVGKCKGISIDCNGIQQYPFTIDTDSYASFNICQIIMSKVSDSMGMLAIMKTRTDAIITSKAYTGNTNVAINSIRIYSSEMKAGTFIKIAKRR